MNREDIVVLKKYRSVQGFSRDTEYIVESGAGDFNLSPVAKKAGMGRLSKLAFNIVDDNGNIRTCSTNDFRKVA